MKARITNHSYVIDFMDDGFGSSSINEILESEINELLKTINNQKLEGWELQCLVVYNTARNILIYRKGSGYPEDKYKEITIHIPIPTIEQISWGVKKEQCIYQIGHLDKVVKNYDQLPVNYSQFNNRTDFLLDSIRRAILLCLNKGITVNGVKIAISIDEPK